MQIIVAVDDGQNLFAVVAFEIKAQHYGWRITVIQQRHLGMSPFDIYCSRDCCLGHRAQLLTIILTEALDVIILGNQIVVFISQR